MSQINRHYSLAADASPATVAALIALISADFGNVVGATPGNDNEDEGGTPTTATVDKDGVPWDERIHSGKKTTKADGTWTRRKNVADASYNRILAELKAGQSVTQVGAIAPQVVTPQVPVNPAQPQLAMQMPTLQMQQPLTKYQSLVNFINRNTQPSDIPGAQLNPDWINAELVKCGAAGGLASIANNEEFCGQFEEALRSMFSGAGITPR